MPNLVRLLRCVILLMFAHASNRALAFPNQTLLRDALHSERIPLELVEAADLERPITSGDVTETQHGRIFAYPILLSENRMSEYFYLFQRTAGRWRGGKRSFANIDSLPWGGGRESELGLDCEDGGGIRVSSTKSFVLISGGMGPSASCNLVLTPELKPVAKIGALHIIELSPQQLLLHANVVHVAPSHPLGLWRYDIGRGATRIYPKTPMGSLRTRYIEQLGDYDARCKQRPSCFELMINANYRFRANEISESPTLHYNANLDALTLLVDADETKLNAIAEAEGAPRIPNGQWVYVLRNLRAARHRAATTWVELSTADFIQRFGAVQLKEAPTKAMLDALFETRAK
jgi:hypothetical protein